MIDEMKLVLRGLVCCLIMGGIFAACSESITNPITPGSGLIGRDVIIKHDTLFAVRDTTFLQRVATDGILFSPLSKNLVGKNGNYTAYTALRFYPPARDTINVLSAKITLRLITWRGDSSGTFAFTVHKILPTWEQTSLKWPTVDSTGFYETGTRGSYSGSLGPDTTSITVDLDTAMVREWFRTGAINYGILLKPTSACSIIRGIHAFDYDSTRFWPKLEVIAQNIAGTVKDTTTFQVGADTYVANVDPFTLPVDHLFSQAGIVYRSLLKFDATRIPRGSIINSAELLLERDPALTTINKFTTAAQPGVDALLSSDSTVFSNTMALGTPKINNTFTFDIREQVQLWTNGHNYGLLLRQPSANEYSTLDLWAFYSQKALNPALRPRVIVKYSVFQ